MKKSILLALSALQNVAYSINLDLDNVDSVKAATATIAYDMLTYYSGNETGGTPGILPGPCASDECYYWWQAGAMWSGLINYWQWSGDSSYQATVIQALKHQIGPEKNYNPPNQSKNMGIDDQDFWGFAAMEAAEAGMPDDPEKDFPSWLALAQAVWNFQHTYWDTATCGGGFRWQIFPLNGGYNLKNTISNGGFFQLSARLARYTGNTTYADWADKVFDWMEQSVVWEHHNDGMLYIWDNTNADDNCTTWQRHVWSYNYGVTIMGAAMMWNITSDPKWKARIDDILHSGIELFFPEEYGGGQAMVEFQCEITGVCNSDQSSFKAYWARWLGVTALLAPWTWDTIMPRLRSSAMAAAGQCVGGATGSECGRQWWSTTWDGSRGVGQQMCALSVISATQLTHSLEPLTLLNGGNSKSDPNAGVDAPHNPEEEMARNPITDGDRTGAAIFTLMIVAAIVGLAVWLII